MPAVKAALEEWIPKSEAARLLGVSLRQLERREQNGFVEKRTMPRLPTESTGRVLYSRADLVALKAGRPNIHAREVSQKSDESRDASTVKEAPSTDRRMSTALARISDADPFAGLAARLAGLSAFAAQYAPPAPAKPWLTLEEAVEFSGLPRSYLLAEARSGASWLFALNVGTKARASWRFGRDSLGSVK